jgi:hypothetical protein
MVRAVVVLARGPKKGRQLIVNVMAAASNNASTTKIHPKIFPSFFMCWSRAPFRRLEWGALGSP